jgi:hypothetical protein
MINILTIDEVRKTMRVDEDYDSDEISSYQELSTEFVFNKTGYFSDDEKSINLLSKQLAKLYIKTQFYTSDNYNQDYDYSLGINGLIQDLQGIVRGRGSK